MPPYLIRKDNTYYFRQAVPAELRTILGRREIKRSLGGDYHQAVRACKRVAVEADNILAEARAQLDARPADPYSWKNIRQIRPVLLTQVTPTLELEFGNLIRNGLLETDENKRIEGMTPDEFTAYGQHIEAGLAALRRQLARGDVLPMMNPAQVFLVGRGYEPTLTESDWRRLAYVMTQANLEAYEAMAARQSGAVVKPGDATVLASQYEVQHAQKTAAAVVTVTWRALYDLWIGECERREKTREAYLAAMKLFNRFCSKTPQTVTREDALAYRDFLVHEQKLAPGTVANKIGFVGTLINSGRNSSQFAKHLPHNPFENIKIKESKRGKADKKRLPFSDAELKLIFSSSIYTAGVRPQGGAGEAAAWIPAIAYLTGMRLEEIALLKTSQFHTDAQGVPYIHTDDGKNDNSADRDVPIHPMLIKAGLLDYVKGCPGRLFPKVQCTNEAQSAAFSKWYGRYLDTLGITAKSKVFHSFRHLFKDLCRNAGMDDSAIDQICGHEPGTVGGRYGSGRRIDVLAGLIATIKPPVALPKITPPLKG
jgi:integrase